MTTIDTSRVDRMEERNKIDAHEKERAEIVRQIEAAQGPFQERIAAIEAEMEAATAELDRRLEAHDEMRDVYKNVLEFDDDDNPQRCVVSGLVLLDGDELVRDMDDREALKALLPWPDDDDAGDDEEAEEDEAA